MKALKQKLNNQRGLDYALIKKSLRQSMYFTKILKKVKNKCQISKCWNDRHIYIQTLFLEPLFQMS